MKTFLKYCFIIGLTIVITVIGTWHFLFEKNLLPKIAEPFIDFIDLIGNKNDEDKNIFLDPSELKPLEFKENQNRTFFPIPKNTILKIECDPQNPKTTHQWREYLQSDFTVNGGYFDANFIPVGYTKTLEDTWGKIDSYPAFLGIKNNEFFIGRTGEDNIKLEASFPEIIESFPLLVENGKAIFPRETQKYARRTVIGKKDETWGIYIFNNYPSLFEVSNLLEEEGFSIALNLDGGPSTGFASDDINYYSSNVSCVISGTSK